MDKKRPLVNILWTGGWDSTFRILQLAQKEVLIQPYYIKDFNRKSQQIELNTMKNLTKDILAKESTRCKINDVITLRNDDFPKDNTIREAYNSLKDKVWFGAQYVWFALLAKNITHLELTVHTDDKALAVIDAFGKTLKTNDEITGENYILDPSQSSQDLVKVFGAFRFPLLNYTKIKMKNEAEEHDFIHIMNKTWFCHRPINNEACGSCNPCVYTIEEGMGERVSKAAMRRYKRRMYSTIPRKILVAMGLSPVIDKIRSALYPSN